MELVLKVDAASVYDDVLADDDREGLWRLMDGLPYVWTNSGMFIPVWSWAEGAMMRGPQWAASGPDWHLTAQAMPQGSPALPNSPPPLANLLRTVLDQVAEMPGIPEVGTVHMLPYVWPPKSNICWHTDGMRRIGAFTYYVHRAWNAEWGGEFMSSDVHHVQRDTSLDNSAVSEAVMSSGIGTWVAPKPNRLIINPSGMLHKVTKTAEGAAPRMSIQGFLYGRS